LRFTHGKQQLTVLQSFAEKAWIVVKTRSQYFN